MHLIVTFLHIQNLTMRFWIFGNLTEKSKLHYIQFVLCWELFSWFKNGHILHICLHLFCRLRIAKATLTIAVEQPIQGTATKPAHPFSQNNITTVTEILLVCPCAIMLIKE